MLHDFQYFQLTCDIASLLTIFSIHSKIDLCCMLFNSMNRNSLYISNTFLSFDITFLKLLQMNTYLYKQNLHITFSSIVYQT